MSNKDGWKTAFGIITISGKEIEANLTNHEEYMQKLSNAYDEKEVEHLRQLWKMIDEMFGRGKNEQ